MANLLTATQRPEVASVTPPATKILGARDQNRHRGPAFGEQLENITRDRPETVARDRRNSASEPERSERRDTEPRAHANDRDDRAESRRDADRSDQSSHRADESRDRTDDSRNQNSDANAQEQDSASDDTGANAQDSEQTRQSDDQTDSPVAATDGATPVDAFADAVKTLAEAEAAPAEAGADTGEIVPLEETVDTTQSQVDPALLGTTAGITGAAAVAQSPAFAAASAGLTQRPGEFGASLSGTPLNLAAAPTDASSTDPTTLASGDDLAEGGSSKQELQGERAFERALAARNAQAPNESRGANGFQAASAARSGDLGAVDPTVLPVGTTPQGQAGTPSTVIRMVPAATIGQASSVPVHTMAFHIARNVDNGVNRFEIRVDPPELGKIDVTMEVQSDGKVRVHMVVERSEALDFLQRDARALEKALADAGLDADADSISFSLEQHDKDANGKQNDEFDATDTNGHGDDNEPTDIPVSGTPRQYLSATGVDIRI